jgi:hypothetical protein
VRRSIEPRGLVPARSSRRGNRANTDLDPHQRGLISVVFSPEDSPVMLIGAPPIPDP